jgi:predicted enzyme related to lactoylglutathione lyase
MTAAMSERADYPIGAPCWVDTLQPDLQAAARFYGRLLGWRFDEPRPMPQPLPGQYLAARIEGRLVTGIGQAPDASPTAVWSTYVRVDRIDDALTRVTDAGGTLMTGPLDAGADGSLAVVTDATGVALGLWQAAERTGAQLVNEPGTWAMSALHTPSAEAAQAFYGAVFGWQLEPVPGAPLSLWRLPGYRGGEPGQPFPPDVVAVATQIDDASDVPPHWAVNFRVEDVDATAEQAAALGGMLLLPPTDTPGFRNAVIADPQKGVIAISAPTIA